jgi:ribosomal protein L1
LIASKFAVNIAIMKTTIDFPEDLLQKVKIAAVQRKTTLRELVVQGVDYIVRHPELVPDAESERKKTIKRLLAAMKAGNTEPVVPLTREEIYVER